MRISHIALVGFVCAASVAFADGPADRVPTNPRAVSSTNAPPSTPLPVDALLTTTRIFGVTHSNDGRKLAYTSSASGRLNLWIMNVDGTGAQQLIKNNDRQVGAHFTHDDSAIVYSQDRGGNEYYDIYVVPVSGGEPRNLTNTDDVSETVDEFSPDGKLLAIGVKQKTTPATNLAVMQWPSGAIRQLTHETDPKASWDEDVWSPDGKFIFATRSIGTDDSEIFRIDADTGKSEELLAHAGKQLVSIADVSHDGGTLLLTSNAKGGYENVALLDLATKNLRWLTDTQWSEHRKSAAHPGDHAAGKRRNDCACGASHGLRPPDAAAPLCIRAEPEEKGVTKRQKAGTHHQIPAQPHERVEKHQRQKTEPNESNSGPTPATARKKTNAGQGDHDNARFIGSALRTGRWAARSAQW